MKIFFDDDEQGAKAYGVRRSPRITSGHVAIVIGLSCVALPIIVWLLPACPASNAKDAEQRGAFVASANTYSPV